MARPRKPTAVKKLQGTLQPCRTNPNEPMPEHSLRSIVPPAYLSKTAQEIWRFAVEQAPEEMLTSLDFAVFACWADTVAKIMDCEKILAREGTTFTDPKTGLSAPHPMLKFQNDLKYTLRSYLTELGFTPASRSKVSVRKSDKPTNEFIDV